MKKPLIYFALIAIICTQINLISYYSIEVYQKFISPHKGYKCAYGVLHETGGCSEIVQQIILTQGVYFGMDAIKNQFVNCSIANDRLTKDIRSSEPDFGCCSIFIK